MNRKMLTAALTAALAFGIAGPAAAAGIENITALTTPGHFGQKIKAVFVEYDGEVDAEKLDADSFELKVLSNNLTGETTDAVIERVYTNSAPEMLEEGSAAGNYVVIETSDFDHAGLVAEM